MVLAVVKIPTDGDAGMVLAGPSQEIPLGFRLR